MRILVAPDSFAGWLSAPAVADAIAEGWLRAAPADRVRRSSLSDGGPGCTEFVDLPGQLADVDLVVTGTAALDWSSLRGSVVAAVASAALEVGRPVIILAGRVEVGRRELAAIGVDSAYAIDPTPAGGPARDALAALAERVARTWSGGG